MGVSDGRTALDLFDRLKEIYSLIEYEASDYESTLTIATSKRLKVSADSSGKIAEIVWGRFVLRKFGRLDLFLYPINFLLTIFLTPFAKRLYKNSSDLRTVRLFCSAALQTANIDKRFKLGEGNILTPFSKRFHIIRAMNLLNRSYFTDDQFRVILKHIHSGLLDGGLLITGSNQDAGSLVNGGIYQKTKQGFNEIYQSGGGSPISDLIQSFLIE